METVKVDVPVEMKERFGAMLDKFSRENNVRLVVRRMSPGEDQPRH
jgi:hypothetical protein